MAKSKQPSPPRTYRDRPTEDGQYGDGAADPSGVGEQPTPAPARRAGRDTTKSSTTLIVRTPTFAANHSIPSQFSRDGGNISPLIEWQGAPRATKGYALVVEDPDAPRGTFRHWAAYNIPADARQLAEGAGSREQGAALKMATNDFGNARYDGPQPPPGDGPHRYHFRLFALNVPELDVAENASAEDVLEAAMSHSIAEADTVGLFARREA